MGRGPIMQKAARPSSGAIQGFGPLMTVYQRGRPYRRVQARPEGLGNRRGLPFEFEVAGHRVQWVGREFGVGNVAFQFGRQIYHRQIDSAPNPPPPPKPAQNSATTKRGYWPWAGPPVGGQKTWGSPPPPPDRVPRHLPPTHTQLRSPPPPLP